MVSKYIIFKSLSYQGLIFPMGVYNNWFEFAGVLDNEGFEKLKVKLVLE